MGTTETNCSKSHSSEWKDLLRQEIESRHDLASVHRLELEVLRSQQVSRVEIARILVNHMHEYLQLRIVNQERRFILKDKHIKEASL